MTSAILIGVAAGAVASLLSGIRSGNRTMEVLSKTAASACFVLLGWLRWSAGSPVETWIAAGLVLCAAGDLLLLSNRSFDLGLAAFLAGHLCYLAAFAVAVPLHKGESLANQEIAHEDGALDALPDPQGRFAPAHLTPVNDVIVEETCRVHQFHRGGRTQPLVSREVRGGGQAQQQTRPQHLSRAQPGAKLPGQRLKRRRRDTVRH